MNPSEAVGRISINKEKQSTASSAAVVLAAVNSTAMLNPLIRPLVDPQACASAIVNATHSSYPEVLLSSNQVKDNQICQLISSPNCFSNEKLIYVHYDVIEFHYRHTLNK